MVARWEHHGLVRPVLLPRLDWRCYFFQVSCNYFPTVLVLILTENLGIDCGCD